LLVLRLCQRLQLMDVQVQVSRLSLGFASLEDVPAIRMQ